MIKIGINDSIVKFDSKSKNEIEFFCLFIRVDSRKQRNGFPPNYIHSIDASHMMLTSLEMNRYSSWLCM